MVYVRKGKMKKLLVEIISFLLGSIILFIGGNIVYYKMVPQPRLVAFEVFDAIAVAEQNMDYTKLVIGDSVARQIFNPDYQTENTEVCYMATNQAITVAGNTILLERFIQNNPQLKEVYYVVRPDSLESNANFIHTYSYFITPLYITPLKQYLSADTQKSIDITYGKLIANNNFSKWILAKYPKLLEYYYNACQFNVCLREQMCDTKVTPDLSLPYLVEMKRICEEKQVTLHLISAPVPDNYEYRLDSLEKEMNKLGLNDLFKELVDDMQFVNRKEFFDGIHMSKEYVNKHRTEFRDRILSKSNI